MIRFIADGIEAIDVRRAKMGAREVQSPTLRQAVIGWQHEQAAQMTRRGLWASLVSVTVSALVASWLDRR